MAMYSKRDPSFAIAKALRKNKVTFDHESYVFSVDYRDSGRFSIDFSALKVGSKKYFGNTRQVETTHFR